MSKSFLSIIILISFLLIIFLTFLAHYKLSAISDAPIVVTYKADNTGYERVARNIHQVDYGQSRDSVVSLLGSPVRKSEFESNYMNPPGSLNAMEAVSSEWWFDGQDVYIVLFKKQDDLLTVCSWRKAIKRK